MGESRQEQGTHNCSTKDEAGGRTLTKGKVKVWSSHIIKCECECREEQGIRGGPNKDKFVAGGSNVTKGKIKAESREEQGMHCGPTKVEYVAKGQFQCRGQQRH